MQAWSVRRTSQSARTAASARELVTRRSYGPSWRPCPRVLDAPRPSCGAADRAPMRGLVFKGNRQVALADFAEPVPGPGEVLVAIRASGICGSDLNLYRRTASFDR